MCDNVPVIRTAKRAGAGTNERRDHEMSFKRTHVQDLGSTGTRNICEKLVWLVVAPVKPAEAAERHIQRYGLFGDAVMVVCKLLRGGVSGVSSGRIIRKTANNTKTATPRVHWWKSPCPRSAGQRTSARELERRSEHAPLLPPSQLPHCRYSPTSSLARSRSLF